MEFIQAIHARKSTRKYSDEAIPLEIIDKIQANLDAYIPVFGAGRVRFKVFGGKERLERAGLGFGLFKFNAPGCIVGICTDHELGMAELGFAMEKEVLKLTQQGLGTCWLGTFNKKSLSELCGLSEGEQIGIVVSFGYKSDHFMNKGFRSLAGSTKRKSIGDIFKASEAVLKDKELCEVMQLSILSPSANNLQPVRASWDGKRADFWINSKSFIDAGIFMSHFYLCLKELFPDRRVSIEKLIPDTHNEFHNCTYVASVLFYEV